MYDYKNKITNVASLNDYMLLKTLSMFTYENLPPTLKGVHLEKQLQKEGYTFITEVDGVLYSFTGGLGGEMDVYGNPTTISITSPALKYSATLNIESDGVLIKNDDLGMGILPIFNRYNTLLNEIEVTMFMATYNARIQTLISAGDDTTKESAEKYIQKIVEGELGIIGENRLFEGLKAQTAQTTGSVKLTELVEFNQYIKASLFNEVGLNANFNMKRERLNSSEVELNSDNLYPLIDNMYMNRFAGIEKLNEKYGLQVTFDFASSWKSKSVIAEQIETETEQIETETEQIETETEQEEEEDVKED